MHYWHQRLRWQTDRPHHLYWHHSDYEVFFFKIPVSNVRYRYRTFDTGSKHLNSRQTARPPKGLAVCLEFKCQGSWTAKSLTPWPAQSLTPCTTPICPQFFRVPPRLGPTAVAAKPNRQKLRPSLRRRPQFAFKRERLRKIYRNMFCSCQKTYFDFLHRCTYIRKFENSTWV